MKSSKTSAALKVVDDDTIEDAFAQGCRLRRRSDGNIEYQRADDQWSFLCSPITAVALTRNSDREKWGRLIEIKDDEGFIHTWTMPASMLTRRRLDEVREVLLDFGADLAEGNGAEIALLRYLKAKCSLGGKKLPKARTVNRTGWDGEAFALPDRAIGASEKVIYQNLSAVKASIAASGDLKDWQATIGRAADGNSRLALAISGALAAPLLAPLGHDGFGLHFYGPSSIGKTTALIVAASIWGSRDYCQNWRTTANGLEALAEAHNDLPLCLDELGQIRGDHATQIAYLLSGGKGKTRANKNGSALPRKMWCVLLLSTGELGLAQKMREENSEQRLMAGQAVRFIEVPADTMSRFGLFEFADGDETVAPRDRGKAFAESLHIATRRSFGTVGPLFVEAFIADREQSLLDMQKTIDWFVEKHAQCTDGQVQRVATSFGVLAAAGELAQSYGLLNWAAGNARTSASRCFTAWMNARGGTGSHEIQAAINQLKLAIEEHGDARFQRWDKEFSNQLVRDRLGFRRGDDDGDIEYLIGSESWKKLLKGHDPIAVAGDLAVRGILRRGTKGDGERLQMQIRMPNGKSKQRFYVLRHSALFDDEAAKNE